MRGTLPTLLVLALFLSGCSARLDPELDAQDALASALVRLAGGNVTATGDEPLTWQGGQVSADGPYTRDAFDLHLDLPPDYWSTHTGSVQIGALWEYANYYRGDPRQGVLLDIRLVDAEGRVVASTGDDPMLDALPATTSSVRTSTVLVVPELPAGAYRVDVTARSGHTSYTGFALVHAEPRDAPARELLPNLVTLTPINVAIDHPRYLGTVKADGGLVGRPGCSANELVLQQAQRCLRFGNLVGNAGPGPFVLWVVEEDVPGGMVGLSRLMQRIYSTDGSHRDRPAGPSDYDVPHRHRHVQGITHFQLFAYDWEAKDRGEAVVEVRKNGWNPAHTGLIDIAPSDPINSACQPRPEGQDCLGLSANWYDLYSPDLPEQYLDITGVPDGVYELVATVNVDAVIEETDDADNSAGLVIRIRGDEVDVLGVPPA